MKDENGAQAEPQTSTESGACCASNPGMSRMIGGTLLGAGGAGALLAVLCCAAPWLPGGLLAALGLSYTLKDRVLLPLALIGLALAAGGWWLINRRTDRAGGAA